MVLGAAPSQARELHWKSLAVAAELDAAGVLHVRERQHMVLTGDWNGGERVFLLYPTQEVVLHGMTRVDPATGSSLPMREGSLDDLDHYGWISASTLRWRGRLTTDPEFRGTEIVYDLDYSLYGALKEADGAYVLDHDFAFADRQGVIEDHAVTLRIDPAWRVDGPRERTIHAGRLLPGASNVVRLRLEPTGQGAPAAVSPRQGRLLLALAGVPLLLLVQLLASEWIRGRFARLTPRAAADPAWLERNLLRHPAELVGAVWDRGVGPEEVAAVVARLAAEKKLETRVDGADHLHMTLKADRETLGDYERSLVDGFFFDGRDETSTADVREHYKATGFDPSAKIRPGLESRAAALVGPSARRPWLPIWLPTLLAFSAGMYLLWRAPGASENRILRIVCVVVPALLLAGFGTAAASRWRGRIDRGLLGMLGFLIPGGLLVTAAVLAVTGFQGFPLLPEALAAAGGLSYDVRRAVTLIALAFFNSIVNTARSRERGQGIALRKRLASARRYFQDQLARPEPALRDEWFPYVLAFGLDDDAQKWFRAHGGQSASGSTASSWSGSSSTSSGGGSWSGGSSGWTGGGGAFGGAGASASWAVAASSLSAGVSAPSSSGGSSGGGGGGGGSSSGGGGGGGW
jgi:uncharacterized membrane protein YgcG